MTRAYAANTRVSVVRSRDAIEQELKRWGATGFGFMEQHGRKAIMFQMPDHRMVKFLMPELEDDTIERMGRAERSQWRALFLVIKAKLVAVDSGISTFEAEFMAATVLPDGQMLADAVLPGVNLSLESGKMPNLLGTGD